MRNVCEVDILQCSVQPQIISVVAVVQLINKKTNTWPAPTGNASSPWVTPWGYDYDCIYVTGVTHPPEDRTGNIGLGNIIGVSPLLCTGKESFVYRVHVEFGCYEITLENYVLSFLLFQLIQNPSLPDVLFLFLTSISVIKSSR